MILYVNELYGELFSMIMGGFISMIFYFTGTGNSQFVAETMNQSLHDEMICINHEMKEKTTNIFHSDKPYVFVVPTHGYRVPRAMNQYIHNITLNGTKDIYFVLTCGGSVGNAHVYAKTLTKEKQMNFRGLISIVMPENYIALFHAPNREKAQAIILEGEKQAQIISQYIIKNQNFPKRKSTLLGWLLSTVCNPLFYCLIVKDKGMKVNEQCIHCHQCEYLCPVNNIKMIDNKPVFQHRCIHCMACICSCPTEAIIYKNRTQNKNHYLLKNVFQEERISRFECEK